jgi:hypothetical protein
MQESKCRMTAQNSKCLPSNPSFLYLTFEFLFLDIARVTRPLRHTLHCDILLGKFSRG